MYNTIQGFVRFVLCVVLCSTVLFELHSETVIPGGPVSGVWNIEGSPYIVTGSISIEDNRVLTILPGVEIRCEKAVQITVRNDEGIVANGTRDSLIIFTSNLSDPVAGNWGGITLYGTERRSSFKHCIIEYAQYGLACRAWASGCDDGDNYTKVDSCIFRFNSSAGLYLRGSGSSTSGCSFPKTGACMAEITNNIIHDNRNGIDIVAYDGYLANGFVGATIRNNVIYENSGDGIKCFGDDPVESKIINNTIVRNGSNAISFINNFDPQDFHLINNIIASNQSGVVALGDSIPTFEFNDVWNNQNNYVNFQPTNSNLSSDPLFVDPDSADFHLTENSPCIDAGDPSLLDPDNTISDIGALYFHHYMPPLADFEAESLEGLAPLTVSFYDRSTGDVDSWLWKFGDDSLSTMQNPVHAFYSEGNYTIVLVVAGPAGIDSLVREDYIVVRRPQPPKAGFTAQPTSGAAPLKVQFNNTSGGDIDSFMWDFGDGQKSAERDPLHEYKEEGKYTVSLTAAGPLGDDTIVRQNYIFVEPSYENLVRNHEFNNDLANWEVLYLIGADFDLSIDRSSALSGTKSVRFDIRNGGPDGWYIQLNQEMPVKKDYYYEISFKAKLQNAARMPIVVESLLDVSPYTNYFNEIVWLEDTLRTYGPFFVRASASDAKARFRFQLGKTNDVIVNIDSVSVIEYKAPPPPKLDFHADRRTGNAPLIVKFSNETVGIVDKYVWEFGDGTTSTLHSPRHVYNQQGDYDVSLTVIGASGDTVSLAKPQYIIVDYPVSVETSDQVSHKFQLTQNYPNPFNNSTAINYELQMDCDVILAVYDLRGKLIRQLFANWQLAGEHIYIWEADEISSGSYFIKLEAGPFSKTIKTTLIK